jgi:RNA polymerase sigma factor (sigma-70 family)
LIERFERFAKQRVWDNNEVDDIVQSAMEVIAREFRSIEINVSFTAWAYKVLENKMLNYFSSRTRERSRFEPLSGNGGQESSYKQDPILKSKLLNCLKKLNKINNRHARILNMRYQGYNTGEICEKLGLSRNGVYILLSRARKMLETCLKTGEIQKI